MLMLESNVVSAEAPSTDFSKKLGEPIPDE